MTEPSDRIRLLARLAAAATVAVALLGLAALCVRYPQIPATINAMMTGRCGATLAPAALMVLVALHGPTKRHR